MGAQPCDDQDGSQQKQVGGGERVGGGHAVVGGEGTMRKAQHLDRGHHHVSSKPVSRFRLGKLDERQQRDFAQPQLIDEGERQDAENEIEGERYEQAIGLGTPCGWGLVVDRDRHCRRRCCASTWCRRAQHAVACVGAYPSACPVAGSRWFRSLLPQGERERAAGGSARWGYASEFLLGEEEVAALG